MVEAKDPLSTGEALEVQGWAIEQLIKLSLELNLATHEPLNTGYLMENMDSEDQPGMESGLLTTETQDLQHQQSVIWLEIPWKGFICL